MWKILGCVDGCVLCGKFSAMWDSVGYMEGCSCVEESRL